MGSRINPKSLLMNFLQLFTVASMKATTSLVFNEVKATKVEQSRL